MIILVNKRTYKRVRIDGELTPMFKYYAQAIKYIGKHLGDSPYVIPYGVDRDDMSRVW